MVSEILQNLFFAVDYIFDDLFKIWYAGLIILFIVFCLIFQLTKR